MTNMDDKHLNALLDSAHVDLSPARLHMLENRIMDAIEYDDPSDLYFPMTYTQSIGTLSVVGLVATVLLFLANHSEQANQAPLLFANSFLYGGF